jgi:hypothetical protein
MRNALQVAVGQPSASRCTFNVFEVTRRSGFEVTTHSALLCDLLNPWGSHGQGGAFLKAFLEMVDGKLPPDAARPTWPPADGWWTVAAERPAEEGRLDIVLKNRCPSGGATIIIENNWGPRSRRWTTRTLRRLSCAVGASETVAPKVPGLPHAER